QASVRTNPLWLRQAFDILIDNAVDAMAQSDTRQLTLATRAVGRGVEITITDTGPGIPEHTYPKLFREPIAKPKGAKGMGMGLLIAQLIVHMQDGEINCISTSSAGTTMRVWLPLEMDLDFEKSTGPIGTTIQVQLFGEKNAETADILYTSYAELKQAYEELWNLDRKK